MTRLKRSHPVLIVRICVPLLLAVIACFSCGEKQTGPLRSVIDLSIGESAQVELTNGKTVAIELLAVNETRDDMCGAIRSSSATVKVNGVEAVINSATYNLPVTVGDVQIDCPITSAYYGTSPTDPWGLEKDARLRLWPAGSPWIEPGTFAYPVSQHWLASGTQMCNEPTFVDGGEAPIREKVYYHWGLDFGGAEAMVEIHSACDGLVVCKGDESLPGYEDTPVSPRYDVIYILDNRGWYYRYSHLYDFDPSVKLGEKVTLGQKIGRLGKEGGSGGWAHLHFDITCRQPSGKWGTEEAYAYAWQAYVKQHKPSVIAVARPHIYAAVGMPVTLDGSRSAAVSGEISKYEWTFSDGGQASGPLQKRTYKRPGAYSEMLKVTDAEGNFDYDFATVQVGDKKRPKLIHPSIHGAFYPTFGIRPGDPVTFKVRSFNAYAGQEVWDFGDGTAPVTVKSHAKSSSTFLEHAGLSPEVNSASHDPEGYAATVHKFDKPGDYIVKVQRISEEGHTATAHLHVEVEEK